MNKQAIDTYFTLIQTDPQARANLVELLRAAAEHCPVARVSHPLRSLAFMLCDHARTRLGGSCRYCDGWPPQSAPEAEDNAREFCEFGLGSRES
jgi:hypothetical protein